MKRILCLLVVCLLLPGCAFFSSFQKDKTASSGDVFLDEFADIPIPQIMKVDRSCSMISVTSEGAKTGLVTVSGNVDKVSLSSAMIHNMAQQGWTLRGMVRGQRIMEVFEKENRFAVITIYDRTVTVAMELWVCQRMADGSTPVESVSGTLKPSDPGFEGK